MSGFLKRLLATSVLLVSWSALAAETAAPAAPATAPGTATAAAATPVVVPPVSALSGGVGSQLMQLVLGLGLVVALIFGLAWLMRRVQGSGVTGNQVIELVGSRALGPRDRLVLVQVGQEQVLLGVSPGSITALHVMNEPVQVPETQNATPEFARRLMEALGNKGTAGSRTGKGGLDNQGQKDKN